jgi:hypothetical protein
MNQGANANGGGCSRNGTTLLFVDPHNGLLSLAANSWPMLEGVAKEVGLS